MPIVEWSDDYKTGNRIIDQEHWGLFALINDLHDKVQSGAAELSIGSTIDALVDYVNVHFEHEERLMEGCAYPRIEEHKKAHAQLAKKAHEFQDSYARDPERFDHLQFMDFLSDWLANHILKVDMAMVPYLQDKPEDDLG